MDGRGDEKEEGGMGRRKGKGGLEKDEKRR